MKKTIPVEIRNCSLRIELAVDTAEQEQKLKRTFEIIDQVRSQFGPNVLLDELCQLIGGEVEKVTIIQEHKPEPVKPSWGDYPIQGNCPMKGTALKMIDPNSIYVMLTNPDFRHVLTQDDFNALSNYYQEWYATQAQSPQPSPQQFETDLPV